MLRCILQLHKPEAHPLLQPRTTDHTLSPLFWQHWLRDDRRYCESSFFRSRVVPDPPASLSAEACRAVVAKRNTTCYSECGARCAF